ncbi:MAG TPA: beta-ketoacyl-ACP synthase II [Candidatus Hydrogenedentes bacterium]|nr:beta-ketoacyl-ACP synthase II [Candidatus Hydrogenedentota bacterium]
MRVVITGMGVVSPLGNSVEAFWKGLCEGRSGVRRIDRFDPSDYASQIAGMAEDCAPEGMSTKDLRRRDRYTQFALYAADQAWKQAGLDANGANPERCGAIVGSGVGGFDTIQEQVTVLVQRGPKRVSPMLAPMALVNMASSEICIRLGLQGPNRAVVTACATGNHCIADAADAIRWGKADVMVTGGSEATIVSICLAGFSSMKALSRRNDEPERASRPFDADRDGFVMGEGAGILVLESEAHARARGAEILGEVAGYAESCDAFHVTAPREDGSGAARAMRNAMHEARVSPEDIGYFNAHGTSTKYNDLAESRALLTVFGESMPPVSSTKSMIGHLLGAAGAVEAIATLMAIREGVLPPSINYDTPDPECPVNIVANEAREADIEIAMSNSLGFGGHNSSLILKRYE